VTDDPAPRPGFRVHPVDLLVLVLAVGLAALSYAYLFRRSPVPRPVDRFLGMVLEVQFEVDRPWKADFPAPGAPVCVDDYLVTDVVKAEGSAGRRTLVLRVRAREGQKPETMTQFRTGVFRGCTVRLLSGVSQVTGEVLSVQEPPAGDQ
jgi:hypothetical protein